MTFTASPLTADKTVAFLAALTVQNNAQNPSPFCNRVFEAQRGPRYTRIVRREADKVTGAILEHSGSAFCFLANDTGHILKCAGFKAPAKHSRGTVHTDTHGVEYLGPHGPGYLR